MKGMDTKREPKLNGEVNSRCKGCVFFAPNRQISHCKHPYQGMGTSNKIGCNRSKTIFPETSANIAFLARIRLGVE